MVSQNVNGCRKDLDPSLQSVRDSMIDGLGQLASYFGFGKVMGQLYGVLMLSPEPMSLDDLMECLDISKANVSMNMRSLEHIGMARQIWGRGSDSRRKYYEVQTDFWQVVRNILAGRGMRDVERAIAIMDENEQLLKESIEVMSDLDRDLTELYIDRIAQIRMMFTFAQLVISTVLLQVENLDLDDVTGINIQ